MRDADHTAQPTTRSAAIRRRVPHTQHCLSTSRRRHCTQHTAAGARRCTPAAGTRGGRSRSTTRAHKAAQRLKARKALAAHVTRTRLANGALLERDAVDEMRNAANTLRICEVTSSTSIATARTTASSKRCCTGTHKLQWRATRKRPYSGEPLAAITASLEQFLVGSGSQSRPCARGLFHAQLRVPDIESLIVCA